MVINGYPNVYLVGGWPTPLQNIHQWEGLSDYPIYYGQSKMFETTNQSRAWKSQKSPI